MTPPETFTVQVATLTVLNLPFIKVALCGERYLRLRPDFLALFAQVAGFGAEMARSG
jgi:hypothetical protein